MAEKSLVNEAGVSEADGGADVDEGAAVDALGAAVVGVVVLLLLLHAASNNPPATTAAVPMVRLDANCPPLGWSRELGAITLRSPPAWMVSGRSGA
jgi:hypothetical protein